MRPDRLKDAFVLWTMAEPGAEAKAAWKDLEKQARRRGLQSNLAVTLVFKLRSMYPDVEQPQ